MRAPAFAVAVALFGCGHDPLREDMKMFCRAADVTNSTSAMVILDYAEPRAKTKELRDLLTGEARGGFLETAEELAKKAGLDHCETIDIILGKAKRVPR